MKTRKVRIHRFGSPEVLRVADVEASMPDALQVLVRVKAASANPRVGRQNRTYHGMSGTNRQGDRHARASG